MPSELDCLQDDPKSSQQRQRYEAARQQAEQQRVTVQKQAWLKQSLARRRVEASRQQQQLLLRSRAWAFHAKVDAIRLVMNLQVVSPPLPSRSNRTGFEYKTHGCLLVIAMQACRSSRPELQSSSDHMKAAFCVSRVEI